MGMKSLSERNVPIAKGRLWEWQLTRYALCAPPPAHITSQMTRLFGESGFAYEGLASSRRESTVQRASRILSAGRAASRLTTRYLGSSSGAHARLETTAARGPTNTEEWLLSDQARAELLIPPRGKRRRR